MKRYINSSQAVGDVPSFCKAVRDGVYSMLGGPWLDYLNCRYDGGPYSKRDFILKAGHNWGTAYVKWDASTKSELVRKLSALGATNIIGTVAWNRIDLAFDLKKADLRKYREQDDADRAAKEAAKAEAERRRNERLDQVDISKYKPTPQIIAKIQDYKDRGSRVNTKAIRSLDKLYTYYYASILLGWQRLYWDILDAFSANFEDSVDHDITARISRDARREREQNAKEDQS